MSIEPIGSIDSNTTSLVELLQVYQLNPGDRHPVTPDLRGISYLTAGDRDLLTALFGPGVLLLANTLIERYGTPQFMLDVIADRKDGQLPVGTELTSTYVQARFDAHANLDGSLAHPLTERNLVDARAYFDNRLQGSAIDLQA